MSLSWDELELDAPREAAELAAGLRSAVSAMRRRGLVVGVSGGIDSAACAALAVRALGPRRVLLLSLPERDSSPESGELAAELAAALGAEHLTEDITATLSGAGCYERQAAAIRRACPEFGAGWRYKLVLASPVERDRLGITTLVVQPPEGGERRVRLDVTAYLEIVAATNLKQRTRTTFQYLHADRLNYAVCGTPNRLEYDQGFFVKGGDGLADVKPIAHLYKSQVYALAAALDVPSSILGRAPTTDTFSLPQSQEEFYFGAPYRVMDLCLLARNRGLPPAAVVEATGLTEDQAARIFHDIDQKRRTTAYLHQPAELLRPVPEVGATHEER